MAQSTRSDYSSTTQDIKEKATDQFEKMADKATDRFKSMADQAEGGPGTDSCDAEVEQTCE